MRNLMVLWAIVFVLTISVGCGGEGTVQSSSTVTLPAAIDSAQSGFGLMTPGDALDSIANRTSSAMQLVRTGSDYAPGLASLVTDATPSVRFNPLWVDGTSGSSNLAFAVYNFNVAGYDGSKVLELIWGEAPPDYTDLWIGLGHWDNNRWDFYPGTEDDLLDLDALTPENYINLDTENMLVALVLLGNDTPLLDSLQVGDTPPIGDPIIITGISPNPALGIAGTIQQFDVAFAGTNDSSVTYLWDFGGGATAADLEVKNPDATLGSSGVYDCTISVDNDFGNPYVLAFTLRVGEPISITSITPDPAIGMPGSEITFDVQFTGNEDGSTTYAWDFGGLATPNNSTEKSPVVTIGIFGSADCSVIVDNDFGEPDTHNFSLEVGMPITIIGITPSPTQGYNDFDLALDVEFNGTVDGTLTFAWFLDNGATPNTPTVKSPVVTLGTPGFYNGSITVDNDYGGPAVHPFTLIVNANQRGDWWMFGRDQQHSWNSPFVGPAANAVKWSPTTGGTVRSSPAIAFDGTVYVGSSDFSLYAYNTDGSEKWSYPTFGEVVSSPAIGLDGTVYVGSADSKLYAINSDGTFQWSFTAGGAVNSSPTIAGDGSVYFGCDDYKLYALNPDGSENWFFTTGGIVTSSPAIATDGTIYVGSFDSNLYAINPDGSEKWSFPTGDGIHSSPVIGTDGTVYVGSKDNNLYAINPDGTEHWAFTAGLSIFSTPALAADGTVYFGAIDNKLYSVTSGGIENWSITIDNIDSSAAIDADGTIYVGAWDSKVYAIYPDSSEKWSYTTGGIVSSSPAIGPDGTVYVGSDDNKLYAFGT